MPNKKNEDVFENDAPETPTKGTNAPDEKPEKQSEGVKDTRNKAPIKRARGKRAPGDPESVRSQLCTMLFWLLALLSTVFFIANIWDNAGPLIEGFCTVLYGLFGWGGLVIVPFFILVALEWKSFVVERNGLYKSAIALIGMVIIASVFHIVMIMNHGIAAPANIVDALLSTEHWYRGTPLGGGVLGGFFGGVLYHLMHGWVSLLTCLILLAACIMLYLRMTPLMILRALARRHEAKKRRRYEEAARKNAEAKAAEEEAKRRAEEEAKRRAEEEAKRLEEEKRSEEEEAEKRRQNPGIDFDFLFAKDKGEKDTVEESTPFVTDTQEEAPEASAPSAEKKESNIPDSIPAPTVTIYRDPDEDKVEERASDEESELDAVDDTDFGFGNDGDDDIDLAALLAAGKKAAEEDRPEAVIQAAEEESDVDEGLAAYFSDPEAEEDDEEYDEDDSFNSLSLGLDGVVAAEPKDKAPEKKPYLYPPTTLLSPNANPKTEDDREELMRNARKLVEVLKSFRVETDIVNISRGPTITRYELAPKVGVRVRAIANLVDDIALNLETSGVRIEAPIPGKAAVGVEVPNKAPEIVYLRDIIESDTFRNAKSKLTACVGMDVSGAPIVMDIAKLPHMLIAGATGMGKSIAVNCIIMSLLFRATPDELKLILVDPKKVEFKPYDKLPHLLIPVVTSPKKAAGALATAVNEMERRFELIEMAGVRDIKGYNKLAENDPTKEKLPSIVIIIDELADLMMTAKDDVEDSICRIAQKARAAGIHLIICTQRPSVDVITGLIKANVPSRVALTVASNVDSRTIIDVAGAEKLIGRGDMLFAPVGAMKPIRVQGAYVSDNEVEAVTTFIRNQFEDVHYDDSFINQLEIEAERCGQSKKKVMSEEIDGDDELDPKYYDAIDIALEMGKISTSLLQRRLSLGYGRAAKIIDKMEQMGVVGPQEGQKPRNILITRQDYQEMIMRREDS